MKIDVLLASRGHPLRLMAVLQCFDALASGKHEVTYRVVCDKDDPLTWKALEPLQIKKAVHIGSGPVVARLNDADVESDAEIVTGAADDTFPLAHHWDEIMAVGINAGHPAFSWQEANDPTNQTMIAFSRKWLAAVGRMLPEYFPFWFGDTWVAEVYEMAFQRPLPIVSNLPWGGKRGKTKSMRDLAFWFGFFAATRVERMGEAKAVCFAYGQQFTDNAEMLADMRRRDTEQLARVPQYEEWFGANQVEASPEYLEMKAEADKWLAENMEAA